MRKVGGWGAISLMMMPLPAIAHGARIETRSTSAVQVQATYDSGEPMAEAQVQIFAPGDPKNPAFMGTTDSQGQYVFVPSQSGDWEVSVRQAGHGDIAVVPIGTDSVTPAVIGTFDTSLNPLQRFLIAGAVTWGCVGTALYFMRGKR